MSNLQEVIDTLDEWDVEPNKIPISRAARNYLLDKAREVIATEEGEEEDED